MQVRTQEHSQFTGKPTKNGTRRKSSLLGFGAAPRHTFHSLLAVTQLPGTSLGREDRTLHTKPAVAQSRTLCG